MSALVESMFSVREVPWHGQGQVLAEYPGSWAEARQLAGLEWDPIEEPVYRLSGVDEQGSPIFAPLDGFKAIGRSDRPATTLAVTNEGYPLIDNAAMGEIIEAISDQSVNVKWETAGSLDGGKAVWALALLDEPMTLPGDNSETYPFLAVTTRHDAKGACTARCTAVRIVCMNTFVASEMEGQRSGATFSFRHTTGWRNRIEEARQALTGARREFRAYAELSQELLGVPVNAAQRERFIHAFIESPPVGLISDRVMNNVETARNAVRSILASETAAPVAHTAYGLVQAAGEYLDHVRKAKSWESKLGRSLLRPEPMKARALSIVRSVLVDA